MIFGGIIIQVILEAEQNLSGPYYPDFSDTAMPIDTNNAGSSYQIASLLREVGANVNMNYNDSYSSASPDHVEVFKLDYGISSDVREASYLPSDVFGEMTASRPVILEGFTGTDLNFSGGHEWVCDGMIATPIYCVSIGWDNYTIKLHMNWGWGGA